MELRPYQREAVEAVYEHLRTHDDNPCVVLPTGCHAMGHPILMHDGSVKPVEEVEVGDLLMGPDSAPRRVLALCRGEDELFRVSPTKGEPFTVNGDHVLSLVCTNEGKGRFPCQRRGGEIEHITVREWLAKPRSWRHLRKLYRVGVEFGLARNLPIPPYILGLLLGDGCLRETVNLTTADEETAEAWCAYADSIGCDVAVHASGGRCPSYALVRRRGKHNVVSESLAALGLAGADSSSKFIPSMYLTASRESRLALLAGLLDTDGSLSRTGFDYSTKSVELAADVVFLARSLGLAAYCARKYSYCQTGNGGWYHRIFISGDADAIPCRLPRKQPRPRAQKKSALRTGFAIEPAGRGPFYGFTLDGDHLYVDGHFVVHHNSGKTHVIAEICRDAVQQWNGRVVVLAHVKELLEQAAGKLRAVAPDLPVGVFSAGLGRRDIGYAVTIAGIQSVYQRAHDLGPLDLVIVDEAHLIPPDGEGMYRRFLTDARDVCEHQRVIGLTATPYRMKTGTICSPLPEGILNEVCFEAGVRELIVQGYLCPLKSRAGKATADTSELHVRGGEFVSGEVEDLMDEGGLVEQACAEIVAASAERRSVLIFCAGVRHAEHVARVLRDRHGAECGVVTGDTPAKDRDAVIDRFKRGDLKFLANVNVLTTGFDAPNVDCVAMLRPTLSPGLYYQMVGRGFRLAPGKTDCVVLDFGGNVLRHGPVDAIRLADTNGAPGEAPAKQCPSCDALIHAAYATCPECGHVFPPRQPKHATTAAEAQVVTGEDGAWRAEERVSETAWHVHYKRGDPLAKPTMRVEYRVGFSRWAREWVCFEHPEGGYARRKAEQWWRARSNEPVPETVEEAVDLARMGALAPTLRVTVEKKPGDEWERIVAHEVGDKPPRLDDPDNLPEPGEPVGAGCGFDDDSIPF